LASDEHSSSGDRLPSGVQPLRAHEPGREDEHVVATTVRSPNG